MDNQFKLSVSQKFYNGFLREKRMQLGFTQDQMAEKLQISKATYCQLERMRKYPSQRIIDKLCKFLNVPNRTLFPEWLKSYEVINRPSTNEKMFSVDVLTLDSPDVLKLPSQIGTTECMEYDADTFFLNSELKRVVKTLSEREQRVINYRYGLEDDVTRTLEEVSKIEGVTRERIRQIEAKALRKLRHASRSNKLKLFLDREEVNP